MTIPVPRPAPGTVRAWYAGIAAYEQDAARRAAAVARLCPDERARFDRYRHDVDRLMFLVGRMMARTLVAGAAGLDGPGWRWEEGPRGRPEVGEPGIPIRFNLAHSAGLVVVALADGHEVGVDVEDRQRRALDAQLVRRYCAPDEAADVEARGAAWPDRFLTYWTLKEAYLKARGLGIAVSLADISLSLNGEGDAARIGFRGSLTGTDTRWAFHLARPTARHLVAIAAPCVAGPVAFQLDLLPDAWL